MADWRLLKVLSNVRPWSSGSGCLHLLSHIVAHPPAPTKIVRSTHLLIHETSHKLCGGDIFQSICMYGSRKLMSECCDINNWEKVLAPLDCALAYLALALKNWSCLLECKRLAKVMDFGILIYMVPRSNVHIQKNLIVSRFGTHWHSLDLNFLPSCEAFKFNLPQRVEMWLAPQFIVSKLLRAEHVPIRLRERRSSGLSLASTDPATVCLPSTPPNRLPPYMFSFLGGGSRLRSLTFTKPRSAVQCTKDIPFPLTQVVDASRTLHPSDSLELFSLPWISWQNRIYETDGRTDVRSMAFVRGVINILNAPRLIDINLVVSKTQSMSEFGEKCRTTASYSSGLYTKVSQEITSSNCLQTAGSIIVT